MDEAFKNRIYRHKRSIIIINPELIEGYDRNLNRPLNALVDQ